jgi:hypothetical protein
VLFHLFCYKDSPLVRAVQFGRVLVIDEVDKAPLEVVVVLKASKFVYIHKQLSSLLSLVLQTTFVFFCTQTTFVFLYTQTTFVLVYIHFANNFRFCFILAVFLQSLLEDGEMTLGDGRRCARAEMLVGAPPEQRSLAVHPNFRVIALANRPGCKRTKKRCVFCF